jgi:hypothetical protein
MMTRSISILPTLALGWCTVFAPVHLAAQTGKGAQKLEQLATQLALTPEQKRQLMPILVAEAPKIEAIKADDSLSKIQKLQKLRAVHDETAPQVKAILSPDQYQKLQGIRKQELAQAVKKKAGQ